MLEFKYGNAWSPGYQAHYYIHTYPNSKRPNELVSKPTANSCREYYIKNIRGVINRNDALTVSMRRAYALVTYGRCASSDLKSWQNNMNTHSEKSLYIINSFEKHHGWQRTKIYPAKCTNIPMPLVFFSGPKRWTMSPYLMSVWALMVRLGRNDWLPKKLLKLNHENLVRQLMIAAKIAVTGDANQLRQTLPEWNNFMFLYKDMFGDNTRKYHWSLKHLNGGNSRPEGILKLISGYTSYKSLHHKYFKLKEANKLK